MTVDYAPSHDLAEEPRLVGRSMWRGVLSRCPNCGEGRMYGRYLKVVEACASCGEELHHQRADDAPPYVVITIVAHVVIGALLWTEVNYQPPVWLHMAIWLPLTVVMSLALLPPVKGALVGLQWALRMHGFGAAHGLGEEGDGSQNDGGLKPGRMKPESSE